MRRCQARPPCRPGPPPAALPRQGLARRIERDAHDAVGVHADPTLGCVGTRSAAHGGNPTRDGGVTCRNNDLTPPEARAVKPTEREMATAGEWARRLLQEGSPVSREGGSVALATGARLLPQSHHIPQVALRIPHVLTFRQAQQLLPDGPGQAQETHNLSDPRLADPAPTNDVGSGGGELEPVELELRVGILFPAGIEHRVVVPVSGPSPRGFTSGIAETCARGPDEWMSFRRARSRFEYTWV